MKSNGNTLLSSTEKISLKQNLEKKFHEVLELMGFDVKSDQQLQDTPHRIAKMYVDELFSGCYSEEPKMTVFENTKEYDEMVLLGPIEIKSVCSHHFLSFIGKAYIGYIPNKLVVGISKLSRIVKWFMRRPQIQEELSKQITDYIESKLEPKGVAVYIEAKHLCMNVRGVEESGSLMKTSSLRGVFLEQKEVREEFFNLIKV